MIKKNQIESVWKNTIKLSLIFCLIASLMFYFVLFWWITVFIKKDLSEIDKSFLLYSIFIFQFVFFSYSLNIFIINSNEVQQQKYRFLWLFLFILALNPFGIIGIFLLIKKQKREKLNSENNIKQNYDKINSLNDKETQIIKIEKSFILWVLYSSIGMMIFIITIPLSIINLINIKKNWKKEEIDIKELKKMAYFSSDIILILASKSAF